MVAHDHGTRCRNTAGVVVKAFANLLEEQAVDGHVPVEAIRRICEAVGGAGDLLDDFYASSEQSCLAAFALKQVDSQRTNYIGRIVTKTFAHVLDDRSSGITRTHLGQFFTALRMILGEEVYDDIQCQCAAIAAEFARPEGVTRWDAFYAHPEIIAVRERILVSIARTFRRFEPRKDWLLIIMNSSPASRSTGSNAFVTRPSGERKPEDFGEGKFLVLFEALFASADPQAMDDGQRAVFVSRWAAPPEEVFGPMFTELARIRGQLSA